MRPEHFRSEQGSGSTAHRDLELNPAHPRGELIGSDFHLFGSRCRCRSEDTRRADRASRRITDCPGASRKRSRKSNVVSREPAGDARTRRHHADVDNRNRSTKLRHVHWGTGVDCPRSLSSGGNVADQGQRLTELFSERVQDKAPPKVSPKLANEQRLGIQHDIRRHHRRCVGESDRTREPRFPIEPEPDTVDRLIRKK